MTTIKRTCRKINAITQAQLIKLLIEGVYTCQQLADETGLHYVTVLQYTRELHRFGAAHISSWEKDSRGRDILKVYKLGAGKDAKRQRMTAAQRQARTRDKKRAIAILHALAGATGFTISQPTVMRLEAATCQ